MSGDYDLKSLVQAHRLLRSAFNLEGDQVLSGARLYLSGRILAQVLSGGSPSLDLSYVISEAFCHGQLEVIRGERRA